MRIAVAQMNTCAGDFDGAAEAMSAYGRRAKSLQADLIVYPAPVLIGADPMALIDNPSYMDEALATLDRLAKNLTVPAIVPFAMGTAGAIFPVYAYLSQGEVHLSGMLDRLGPLEFDDVEIGLAFTFDDLEAYTSGAMDADIICFIPPLGYSANDEETALVASVADGCFVQEARDSESWIVAASACGAYEDYVYTGGSFVMAPLGQLAAYLPPFKEDLLVCDINVESDDVADLADTGELVFDRGRMLWDAAALALRDQVNKRKLAGVVLALDGGLATSALAALAVDAVGPMRVSALLCATDNTLLKAARELAQRLHIHEVDELRFADIAALAEDLSPDSNIDVVVDSLMRVRLGAVAQDNNLLVASSVDKTELALNAHPALSAAASFAPFGDIYRSDVIKIARWRNTLSPVFDEKMFECVAIPEGFRRADALTTAELAINYVDAALLFYFERNAGLEELANLMASKEAAQRLLEHLHASRAYRRFAPAFPVLSMRSLDEAAAPVTDAWIDRGRAQPHASKPKTEPAGAPAAMAEALSNFAGAQATPHLQDVLPDGSNIEDRISEMLGFLQELSEGSRMQRGSNKGSDDDSWASGLFSDN